MLTSERVAVEPHDVIEVAGRHVGDVPRTAIWPCLLLDASSTSCTPRVNPLIDGMLSRYCWTPSDAAPSKRIWPPSIQTTRSQVREM